MQYDKKCEIKKHFRDMISNMFFLILYFFLVSVLLLVQLSLLRRGMASSVILFAVSMIIVAGCTMRVIEDTILIPGEAIRKRRNTEELSRKIRGLCKEEIIRLLLVENYCPNICKAYMKDQKSITLMGQYTKHTLYLEDNCTYITSEISDNMADIEANEIMKFISKLSY